LPGQYTVEITAAAPTKKDVSKTISVTVNVLAKLAFLRIEPTDGKLPVGRKRSFTAIGILSDDSEIKVTENVHWESTDTHIAKVSAKGEVTGVNVGITMIVAKSKRNPIQCTASLEVVAGR
jgi:hypothetical protein